MNSQNYLEQFSNGFFTMTGVFTAVSLSYPLYRSCKFLCNKYFRKNKCNDTCQC